MRKVMKDNLMDVFKTLYDAHGVVRDYIDNGMRQNAKMYIRCTCESKPCEIEIREGSPFGALLGYCKVEPHKGELQEISCRLSNTHGTHNLCFVFRGESDDLLHFDDFCFEQIKP